MSLKNGEFTIVQIATAAAERNTSAHIVQVGVSEEGIPAWRWISPDLWPWRTLDLPDGGRRVEKIAVAMGSAHNSPMVAVAVLCRGNFLYWRWLDRHDSWVTSTKPVPPAEDPLVDIGLALTVVHNSPHLLLVAQTASGLSHTVRLDEYKAPWTTIHNRKVVTTRS